MSLLEKAQQLGIKPYSQMDKTEKIQYHQAIAKKYKAEADLAASEATLTGTATRLAKGVTGALGFDKASDTVANSMAQRMVPQDQQQYVPHNTTGEKIGAALQVGSLLAPVGTMARVAGGVVGKTAGNILAGTATGYAVDTGAKLSEGKTGAEALTPGLGTAIGAGLPGASALASAAKTGLEKIGAKQAPRIINSLIKPLQKEFSYGKNPGRAVAEEGIVAGNLEELGTKITARRQEIGKQLGELAGRIGGAVKINLDSSLSYIDKAMEEAAKANNTGVLQRLEKVKKALTENLGVGVDETGAKTVISNGVKKLQDVTYQEALDFKRAIGELTSFTGNPSDDKLVNASLKRAYGKVKWMMDTATDSIYPEYAAQIRKLNERYADLTSAEIATKYRDKINSRLNLIGLSPTITGIGTAAGAAIATGGAAIPSILLGATAAALDKALSSPAFKTRLASWISKTSPAKVNSILDQVPKLEEVIKNKFNTPGDFLFEKMKKIRPGMSIQDVSKSPLLQEAKKYKSAEEFVKSHTPLFHGTNVKNADMIEKNFKILSPEEHNQFPTTVVGDTQIGLSTSKDKGLADYFASLQPTGKGKTVELYLSPKAKVYELPSSIDSIDNLGTKRLQELKAQGYDAIHDVKNTGGESEIRVLNHEVAKTKSQLTDLYHQATGGETPAQKRAATIANNQKMKESRQVAEGQKMVDNGPNALYEKAKGRVFKLAQETPYFNDFLKKFKNPNVEKLKQVFLDAKKSLRK